MHKGIDIFAQQDTPVVSATAGVVLYQGTLSRGGNVVAIWGPHWQVHYYAHLAHPTATPRFVKAGDPIGAVGTSGNAAGKPPHLHYAIVSLVPLPWHYRWVSQGWKRLFYLDPSQWLRGTTPV